MRVDPFVWYDGRLRPIDKVLELAGIKKDSLYKRMKRWGCSVEEALTREKRQWSTFEVDGVVATAYGHARRTGKSVETIRRRRKAGLDDHTAVHAPRLDVKHWYCGEPLVKHARHQVGISPQAVLCRIKAGLDVYDVAHRKKWSRETSDGALMELALKTMTTGAGDE